MNTKKSLLLIIATVVGYLLFWGKPAGASGETAILTVACSGGGYSVSPGPIEQLGANSYKYPKGTNVQVRSGGAPQGYNSFSHWEDDASGSASPVTVFMDRDKFVTMVWI